MIHELEGPGHPIDPRTTLAKQRSIDRADAVVCISETTRRDLLTLMEIDASRTFVTPLGVEDLFLRRASPRHRTGVLYVGERGGYKNFSLLLQAAARLKNEGNLIEITAFGGGQLTAAEKREIDLLGLASGQVKQKSGTDQDLANQYRRARVFVCPSSYEGFGLPALEAMACGCPVLLSRSGSLPEVGGEAAHYFEPNDLESLSNALAEVVGGSAGVEALVEKGLLIAKRFTWQRCVDETMKVYLSI